MTALATLAAATAVCGCARWRVRPVRTDVMRLVLPADADGAVARMVDDEHGFALARSASGWRVARFDFEKGGVLRPKWEALDASAGETAVAAGRGVVVGRMGAFYPRGARPAFRPGRLRYIRLLGEPLTVELPSLLQHIVDTGRTLIAWAVEARVRGPDDPEVIGVRTELLVHDGRWRCVWRHGGLGPVDLSVAAGLVFAVMRPVERGASWPAVMTVMLPDGRGAPIRLPEDAAPLVAAAGDRHVVVARRDGEALRFYVVEVSGGVAAAAAAVKAALENESESLLVPPARGTPLVPFHGDDCALLIRLVLRGRRAVPEALFCFRGRVEGPLSFPRSRPAGLTGRHMFVQEVSGRVLMLERMRVSDMLPQHASGVVPPQSR